MESHETRLAAITKQIAVAEREREMTTRHNPYEFGLSLRGRYAYADLPLVGAIHIVFNREFLPPPAEHRYVTFETDDGERRLSLGRNLLLSWAPPAKRA